MADFDLKNLDFFDLYHLQRYKSSSIEDYLNNNTENNYLSFIPIEMRTAKALPEYGETSIDSEDSGSTKIVLPWKVGEVSDLVSVSFSSKQGSYLRQAGLSLAEDIVDKILPSTKEYYNEIASIGLVNYNTENLMKTLDLEFILPLTNISKNNSLYNSDFVKNVRRYLGALQGLIYPRGYNLMYPKMMSFNFGSMYRGFRGFLSEVNIRYSDTMVELGDNVFPMVITGSLKFVNVFKYFWSHEKISSDLVNRYVDSFLLDDKPQILFGYEDDSNIQSYIRSGIVDKGNYNIPVIPDDTPLSNALSNVLDKLKNTEGIELSPELTDNLSGGMAAFAEDSMNEDIFNNFELPVLSSSISDVNGITSGLMDDQLSFIGLDGMNDRVSLVDNIQNVLGSVQNVSNYSGMINDIKNNDAFGVLGSITKIVGSSGNVIGETARSIIDGYWPALDIIQQIDSGVDLDNITYLYENVLEILGAVDSLPGNRKADKKIIKESLYASSLQNEKIISTNNNINKALNNSSTNTTMSPVANIQAANLMLLQTEMLKKVNNKVLLDKSLYEKSYEMKSSKFLDSNTHNKFKQIYDSSSKIDFNQLNSINEVLFDKLTEIEGVIS